MQEAQRAWVAEAGAFERLLIAFAQVRARTMERSRGLWRRVSAALVRRRGARALVWTVTLRLPGELGYWLRARRMRGGATHLGRTRMFVARSARPTVSVIIPSFGKVELTLRCLGAIAAHPPGASIEVIVVDDCSGDPKLSRLRQVRGLRLVRTPGNLGFIGAANYGASVARGEMLLFLNNDAFVRPGAIDALAATLRARGDAGAVGAKLLFPNGRLQEAGGIIWRDATGWNYGRGDDPACPVYNYLRSVDYCSAAALMVRRQLFEILGGFDSHFAPAYYEDTDLSFRLRAHGYLTLYQPAAEVVHLEGASHGTDPERGVKARQTANRQLFLERWQEVLDRNHLAAGGDMLRARDQAAEPGRRVALLLEHRPPEPDRDAGSQNLAAVISGLQRAGVVVKLWTETVREERYVLALQQSGVEVATGDMRAFETWIATNGAALDLVIINRPSVAASFLGPLRRHCGARVAFNGMDLHGSRMAMQAALCNNQALAAEAAQMERLERWIWRSVDLALYLSEEEACTARALEPSAQVASITPFCFETFPEPRRVPASPEILFVGGFAHSPNEDAVLWFTQEILPLIQVRVPQVRLMIAGSEMPDRVLALASDQIIVLPELPPGELRALYSRARVSVAPLRFGAGVKLKVVEALREGTPLVTTRVGSQGLPGLDEVAFVADMAEQFARHVCALLGDDRLWAERSAAQIGYARRHFGIANFDAALLAALRLPRKRRSVGPKRGGKAPAANTKAAAAGPRKRAPQRRTARAQIEMAD